MNIKLCEKCGKKPCEKSGKWFRKTCWSCRIPLSWNRKRNKEYGKKIKKMIIDVYGGVCSCCGEKDGRFLSIDHINNNGAKFRKENKRVAGRGFYLWIIKNKYPKDLQLLCFNCNLGRQINGGLCPHKELQQISLGAGKFS